MDTSTIPPIVRHLILLVISGLLSWAGTELVPFLSGQPGYGILASMVLTALLAYFSPLVKAYGVGRCEAAGRPLA